MKLLSATISFSDDPDLVHCTITLVLKPQSRPEVLRRSRRFSVSADTDALTLTKAIGAQINDMVVRYAEELSARG